MQVLIRILCVWVCICLSSLALLPSVVEGIYLGGSKLASVTLLRSQLNLCNTWKCGAGKIGWHTLKAVNHISNCDNRVIASSAARESDNDNNESSMESLTAKRFQWIPNGVKNGIASGLAAILVKIILQPFDTIKTVQHVQTATKLNSLQAAKTIIERNGISGLWSGIRITVIGSSPSVALYFAVYSSLRKRFASHIQNKLVAISASAAVANTIASIARVPYEVSRYSHKTLASVLTTYCVDVFRCLSTGFK
jgi:hypothetical protein